MCEQPSAIRNVVRGFTIVELMIVIALLSIVMLFVFGLFLATIRTTATNETSVRLQDEARITAQKAATYLRGARNILYTDITGAATSNDAGTAVQLTFNVVTDTNDDFWPGTPGEVTADLSQALTIGLDINDVNGDGLTTTQFIFIDADGDILELTRRIVEENADVGLRNAPNGGAIFTRDGFTMTLNLVLEQPATAGYYPAVVVEETRTFRLKN